MPTHQAPVLHGSTLEVGDGDAVVLWQRVADTEVVFVVRDGAFADVQSEEALQTTTKMKWTTNLNMANKRL